MAEVTENADGTVTSVSDDGVRVDSSTDSAEDLAAELGIEVTQQPRSDEETPTESEPGTETPSEPVESEAPAAEAEQAPEDDDDTEDNEDSEPARGRRPGRRERQLRRLRQQNDELAAQRQEDREALAALRAQVETLTRMQSGDQQPDANRPLNPDDFDSQDDYVAALVERRVNEQVQSQLAAQQEQQQRTLAQNEEQRLLTAFNSSMDAAWEAHDDFEEAVDPINRMASDALRGALVSSDNPGELVYHLGRNPDEFARLNTMNAVNVAREIGKIEARLTPTEAAPATPNPQGNNNPPAPIEPVNGSRGPGNDRRNMDEMTQEEFEAEYERRYGSR